MGGVLLLLLFSSCRQIVWVPFPPTMQQDKEPVKWNGTSDTTWYIENANAFDLDTPDELAGLSELVNKGNTFEDKTIYLSESIDLSGFDWDPIGSNGTPFKGTFDGGNNTIIGFSNEKAGVFDDEGNRYFSAFFTAVDGGTVKNITFEDYDVNIDEEVSEDRANQRMISVAVGNLMNGGTVENVTVKEGTITSPVRVSGIVARTSGGTKDNPNRIIDCENYADVSTEMKGDKYGASNTYGTSGGILSTTANGYIVIEDCNNYGSSEGMVAGGIVGDNQTEMEIIGCTNEGNVKGTIFAGGIIGDFWYGGNGSITDCHNTGTVESIEAFSGNSDSSTYGDVNIGGIAGLIGAGGATKISGSTNSGVLKNNTTDVLVSIGGIVGSIIGEESSSISESTSNGVIENKASTIDGKDRNRWTVGGVAGYVNTAGLTIEDSYGTAENFNDENGYYVFGNVIGAIRANNKDGKYSFSYSDNKSLERFGLISTANWNAVENANTITVEVSGANIESLDIVNDRQTLNLNLNDSHIDNIRQLNTMDIGTNWGDYGTQNIKGGTIDTLTIWPEKYPTHGGFSNIFTVSDNDGFNWSCPNYEFLANNAKITINDAEITATSGSWSPQGIVNN